MFPRSGKICRLDWSWKIHFKDGSLTRRRSRCWLEGDLILYYIGLLKCSYNTVTSFPQREGFFSDHQKSHTLVSLYDTGQRDQPDTE